METELNIGAIIDFHAIKNSRSARGRQLEAARMFKEAWDARANYSEIEAKRLRTCANQIAKEVGRGRLRHLS
jgi:hypothetical protein